MQSAPATLGDVLYAKPLRPLAPEAEWVALVRLIAAGDTLCLHELFRRTHDIVFTLIHRLTQDQGAAEALTLDVFSDLQRLTPTYDPAGSTVVGWIMNLARARALAGALPAGRRGKRLAKGAPIDLPWQDVAPGIAVKMLSSDAQAHRVSMLVRLVPGGEYPPHTHAGTEELHLLEGELWIDARMLHAGDYNRAEPGTGDKRVWSETGCSCVLVTSTRDELR